MNISMLLEMAAASTQDAADERPAVICGGESLTAAGLLSAATAAAARFEPAPAVLYLGTNHLAYPVALFGAALANVPFVPLNYRLGDAQLEGLLTRHPGALVLRGDDLDEFVAAARAGDLADLSISTVPSATGGPSAAGPSTTGGASALRQDEDDPIAVVLYTSGTTAAPKAALLRHRHLLAYVWNTVEYGAASPSDAALVSVPPYHVAGLANLLTNLYAGRRLVYLPQFAPEAWLETVRREGVTHALLVPTMLARVVDSLGADEVADTPSLASLAYGGARMPRPVLERALKAFPATGFVNAYGLTETTSSIAVLSPEDHRSALESSDPAVRERLSSVGRALPGVEFQIRREDGSAAGVNENGLIFVRGDQVSGEYGGASALDADGWFPTRDAGRLDADGYLFIEGRADDTIIRGGENIAPAEIEDVLLSFPGITEAVVLGLPDPEWGQRLVAVVVGTGDAEEIRQWVKDRLRSSKTPQEIVFRPELPKTETGKLLRRVLVAELESAPA